MISIDVCFLCPMKTLDNSHLHLGRHRTKALASDAHRLPHGRRQGLLPFLQRHPETVPWKYPRTHAIRLKPPEELRPTNTCSFAWYQPNSECNEKKNMQCQIWGKTQDRASSNPNQFSNWAHENLCAHRKIHWNLAHRVFPSKLDHGEMENEGALQHET